MFTDWARPKRAPNCAPPPSTLVSRRSKRARSSWNTHYPCKLPLLKRLRSQSAPVRVPAQANAFVSQGCLVSGLSPLRAVSFRRCLSQVLMGAPVRHRDRTHWLPLFEAAPGEGCPFSALPLLPKAILLKGCLCSRLAIFRADHVKAAPA